MDLKWKRPDTVPVPRVWARYESKRAMPNGRTPKFRIQDFTEEYRDQLMSNMTQFFLRDEPMSRSLDIAARQDCLEEFVRLFSAILEQKMVLIALVENLNELGDPNLPVFAGCNITVITSKEDPHLKVRTHQIQLVMNALEHLESQVNVFELYGVSEYMIALGLSVHPGFRGHGLGLEILKARAFGIRATATVFTSGFAQKAAEKAGFELLSELEYKDYKNENGEVIFKVDSPKSMKLMGTRIS